MWNDADDADDADDEGFEVIKEGCHDDDGSERGSETFCFAANINYQGNRATKRLATKRNPGQVSKRCISVDP
jgi:hypothetical protein